MNRNRWIRRAAWTGVIALPLLTAGCGIFSQNAAKEIDPPPVETQNEPSGSLQQNGTSSETGASMDLQTGETQMTVYLRDSHGYLAPVTLRTTLGDKEQLGQKALEMMTDGGAYADQLPEGFTGIIPKGTSVIKYTESKDTKLATVDFSKSFTDYNAAEERKIVEAIAWTLTGLPDVSGVELMLEGTKLTEMPERSYPLDRPLDRSVGINLEAADGVDYGQSVPVTLYFSSETQDGDMYYVPVTRLINRTDDLLKASIDQLIAGPLGQSQLIGVMTPDVQVKSVVPSDDMITVNLQDEQYMEGMVEPDEMLQAIILSVTENANASASKVQITLNGETNLLTEPVTRPSFVNALKS